MERTESCAICHAPDDDERLVGWYVGSERLAVHDECWLRVHREEAATHPAA